MVVLDVARGDRQDRERVAGALEADLVRAQLHTLRAQLQPHRQLGTAQPGLDPLHAGAGELAPDRRRAGVPGQREVRRDGGVGAGRDFPGRSEEAQVQVVAGVGRRQQRLDRLDLVDEARVITVKTRKAQ